MQCPVIANAICCELRWQDLADKRHERSGIFHSLTCEIVTTANIRQRAEDHILDVLVDFVERAFLSAAASFTRPRRPKFTQRLPFY